ncbi:MAG: sigma-54-dependent transcriptional regulator [Pirellulaceae bacterium]
MSTLLVVDDEESICWGLTRLGQDLGHRVWTASSAEQAIDLVETRVPDVIVLDVRLPGMDGLRAMEALRRRCGDAPIIIMTAYGDLPTAVTAIRNGAFEYLVKPFDLEQVQRALTRALAAGKPLSSEVPPPVQLGGLIGRSPAMQEVFKRIALAATSDLAVLLQGESGTGKELAARAIHQHSSRAEEPFVAVHVAALSPTLAESELFGHVRGAFTGAERDRAGLLVEARGGTLFLDEIAEIPLTLQVKLLRVLEQSEVLPVGGNQPVRTHFRIISASHQDLVGAVQRGTFRQDLYFRLSGFVITMPALRERPDDIPQLASHFLERVRRELRAPTLSAAACAELSRRPWYGNVRELRSAVEHAATMARGGTIEPEHLPAAVVVMPSSDKPVSTDEGLRNLVQRWTQARLAAGDDLVDLYDQLLRVVEPPLLTAALKRHRQQCAAAARTLGMHRTTLRKKMDEYGLDER